MAPCAFLSLHHHGPGPALRVGVSQVPKEATREVASEQGGGQPGL